MQKKTVILLLRVAVVLLFLPALLVRCASMMTPTGGPKDTLAPRVLIITPENFTTNMKDFTKIYITFDEFVQIKDQQKEFFTSPEMKKKPQLTIRGRGVVVQLRDTMRPNTTYALNFGGTIRDNNEGNPLNSFRYVFSTGGEIDSMLVSGYTADAYKADSASKSFVWFYPADSVVITPEYDSTLFKKRPSVIGRAETNGIFITQNLKPIPYRVYAVQDKNDNQMYDPSIDQIGFLDQTYNPAELPDFTIWYDSLRRYVTADPQLYFRMFTDKTFRRQNFSEAKRPDQHKALFYFNAAYPTIESIVFDSIPSDKVIIEPITKGRDTLALWFNLAPDLLPDTIKGSLTYLKHDSINQLQSTVVPLKLTWRKIESKEQIKEREKREKEREKAEKEGRELPKEKSKFAYKLPLSGEINPEQHIMAEFTYPLVKIDSGALLLTRTLEDESVEDIPVRLVADTASIHRWRVEAAWKLGGKYTLTIPPGTLSDVTTLINDSIVGKYTVMDPEKFATVKVTIIPGLKRSKYILQMLDGSGKLLREKRDIDSGLVQFNYVPAGEIKFRVVEDVNGNGQWDVGSLVEQRQPERTELYMNSEGKDTFTTKTNWEIELPIDMKILFAPVTMQSLIRTIEEREVARLKREEDKRKKEGPKKKENEQRTNNSNSGLGGNQGMGSGMQGMQGMRNNR